jgi:hypothetical protein
MVSLSNHENFLNIISFDKLRMTFIKFGGLLRQPHTTKIVQYIFC